ncbi:MAG: hypothetical protein BGN83_06675 [Rhizobium sp. 63-7]|nr:MAG: hypothetical protein BGN83_06675 [Rhizobium sp. 63-7]
MSKANSTVVSIWLSVRPLTSSSKVVVSAEAAVAASKAVAAMKASFKRFMVGSFGCEIWPDLYKCRSANCR